MSKKWYSFFVVTNELGGAAGSPVPASTPPRRVTDLVEPDVLPTPPLPSSTPATPTGDLAIVYESAQIVAPSHGYTVLKVAEMLQSEHIRALPREVKGKSVLVALDAAGVRVDDIVADAVRRDRALDTYERVLRQHLDDVRAKTAAENAALEEEIAQRVSELRARIDDNTQRAAAEQAAFQAWVGRKQLEEAAIAEAVGYFVSENPVTTGPDQAQKQGDADVR